MTRSRSLVRYDESKHHIAYAPRLLSELFIHRSHFGSRYTSGCCDHASLHIFISRFNPLDEKIHSTRGTQVVTHAWGSPGVSKRHKREIQLDRSLVRIHPRASAVLSDPQVVIRTPHIRNMKHDTPFKRQCRSRGSNCHQPV